MINAVCYVLYSTGIQKNAVYCNDIEGYGAKVRVVF